MLILLACAFATPAAVHRKVDVVLLLDTSASMLTSDPDNLRLKAVRGFMALLDDGDRLAVLSFGDHVKRISDFVLMDGQARLRLEARVIPEMTPSGAYTNLYDPLDQAFEVLRNRRADAEPMVVLFTDGRMDMGDAKIEQRLTHGLIENVLPRFRNSGARIFGLAFSDGSDRGLLDSAALNTGGFSYSARRAEDVWRAFGNLFEDIKKPDRLPVRDGRFLVDSSVTEFKLLSGARNHSTVSVRSPSGRNAVTQPSERGNPVLIVKNPEPGVWEIGSNDGDKTLVAASSMVLAVNLPDYVAVGQLPMQLKAWVAVEAGQVAGTALRPSRMELHWWTGHEKQARRAVPLSGPNSLGEFTGQLPKLAIGTYALELEAVGQEYRRSKNLTLGVVADSAPISTVTQLPISATPLSSPTSRLAHRESLDTAFFGLLEIRDQEGWRTLRIVFWSNLVLCVVIGAVLYWRRRHRAGKPQ